MIFTCRNSGLLSTQQQQMQQAQQQAFSQRNPIGQMPSMSMQGHLSPSHSPVSSLSSNTSSSNKILPPSRSLSSSSMMPTSSAPLSSNFPGFIGNQLNRNVGGTVGQVFYNFILCFISFLIIFPLYLNCCNCDSVF